MGRQRLPRLHLLLIVALALLVFSASLTWTQEKSSARKSQTQLPDLAAQFAAAPETNIRFHPASGNLALTFAPNPGEAPSQVKFRSDNIGYHLSLTQNNALPNLWQIAKRDEMQAKANHFIGNTPNEWFTDVITHNKVNFRTPDPGGDVAYYGHRIPWAGQIILSVGEKAKAHPRVTRVLESLQPGLGSGNRRPPRWVGR